MAGNPVTVSIFLGSVIITLAPIASAHATQLCTIGLQRVAEFSAERGWPTTGRHRGLYVRGDGFATLSVPETGNPRIRDFMFTISETEPPALADREIEVEGADPLFPPVQAGLYRVYVVAPEQRLIVANHRTDPATLIQIKSPPTPISRIIFSPGGERFLVLSELGELHLFQSATGKRLSRFQTLGRRWRGDRILDARFVDGRIFVLDDRPYISEWRKDGKKRFNRWPLESDDTRWFSPAVAGAFTPDGREVLMNYASEGEPIDLGRTIWVYDTDSGMLDRDLEVFHDDPVIQIEVAPVGNLVTTLDRSHNIRVFRRRTAEAR